MKFLLIIFLMMNLIYLVGEDQVTIYNENFSLIRTSLELELSKGMQSYFMEDIPSSIEANSVIIKPLKSGFEIFSQNYEYDLADTDKILEKYIGKSIEVITKSDSKFSGELQFNDYKSIGIADETTGKLNLIRIDEIRNFSLSKLPENFYLKPTLHWKLLSKKAGNYPIDLSYICSGMRWNATYNTVWNEDDKKLELNSWVTITNNTGKAFADTKLKLVAGDVQKVQNYQKSRGYIEHGIDLAGFGEADAPSFEEKAFHDFHLYTLSDNVSINNKQTKQLRLFPTASVKANSKYEYNTFNEKINSVITFINSKKDGLGIPLPKGIVKIYKKDEADNNLEFIGEDRIDHTAKDEEVKLVSGKSFDLIAKTIVVEQRKISRNIYEKDILVELKNHSDKSKTITIIHRLSGEWEIFNEDIDYEKIDANTIEFEKTLKANEIFELTWTERIEH